MNSQKLFWIGAIVGLIGVGQLVFLILVRAAYPSLLFRVLVPLGLLFVLAGLVILLAGWAGMIWTAVKLHRYLWAAVLVAAGLFIAAREVLRAA